VVEVTLNWLQQADIHVQDVLSRRLHTNNRFSTSTLPHLLHVSAGYAGVLKHARVPALNFLPTMRKGTGGPVVTVPLGAGQHLRVGKVRVIPVASVSVAGQ
jgi:hypothetical protein